MIRSGSVIGRASASTGPERSKVSRALSPSSKRCAATATGGCASSARAFMLARKTAAQTTEQAFLAKRAAPRILMPFISAPDAAYLAPSRAEVNEMMRQAYESARAWRGGHRAFAAGQIEASVRSRTFCLQIAAMRRNKQLSEPGDADFAAVGCACALI